MARNSIKAAIKAAVAASGSWEGMELGAWSSWEQHVGQHVGQYVGQPAGPASLGSLTWQAAIGWNSATEWLLGGCRRLQEAACSPLPVGLEPLQEQQKQ